MIGRRHLFGLLAAAPLVPSVEAKQQSVFEDCTFSWTEGESFTVDGLVTIIDHPIEEMNGSWRVVAVDTSGLFNSTADGWSVYGNRQRKRLA